MQSTILSTLSVLVALSSAAPAPAGMPAAVPAQPTANPSALVSDVGNLINGLATISGVGALINTFIDTIETDAVNYALASPSVLEAEVPPLVSAFNAIVASESYLPALTIAENIIESSLSKIAAADATNTAALASDALNLFNGAASIFISDGLVTAIVDSIKTDAVNFALASPAAILGDLNLIVSDFNPIVKTEAYAPAPSTLESNVLDALTTILAYDAPQSTGAAQATGTGFASFTIKPANGTGAVASQTILPFKGAAPTEGVKVMGVLAAVGLGALALL
ncbi:hypothetical protein MMC13_007868 [Lambiella insularis]|nr:hypothetical protein [Lambiella insularis]